MKYKSWKILTIILEGKKQKFNLHKLSIFLNLTCNEVFEKNLFIAFSYPN
jgi:hypothetical protein